MFIKEKRKSLSLTQNDVAKKLKIARSTVAMWEAEKSEPNINQLINLSKLFNCTIDELVNNVQEEQVRILICTTE